MFHSFVLEYPKPPTGCDSWKVVLLVLIAFCLGEGATYGALYILDFDSSSSDSTDQSSCIFFLDAYTLNVINQFFSLLQVVYYFRNYNTRERYTGIKVRRYVMYLFN